MGYCNWGYSRSSRAPKKWNGIRENDTLLVANANGVFKCLVKSISGDDITVRDYNNANLDTATTDGGTTVLVYGSEAPNMYIAIAFN